MAASTGSKTDSAKVRVTKKYSDVIYVINLIRSLDFSDRISKAFHLAQHVLAGNDIKSRVLADEYLASDDKDDTKPRKSAEAFIRALDRDVLIEYNSEVEALRTLHCAVDKVNQTILKDKEGKYEFTREGSAAFNADIKTLSKKSVTFEVRTAEAKAFSLLPPDIIEYLTEFGFLV